MSATQPKDIAVVMLAKVPWNFTWQSDHKIAAGLAKRGYAVTFVQPLPKRMPAAGEVTFALAHWLDRPKVAGYVHQPRPPGVNLVSPLVFPEVNRVFRPTGSLDTRTAWRLCPVSRGTCGIWGWAGSRPWSSPIFHFRCRWRWQEPWLQTS